MTQSVVKDDAIFRLLDRLRGRLGPAAFDVVDHWEADSCAVGIASPRNHGILVYLSTYGNPPDRYDVELELPAEPGSALPYEEAGRHVGVDFDAVVLLAQGHLSRA